MPFFDSSYRDKQSELEQALKGIPLSNFSFEYYRKKNEKVEKVKSPAYLLPLTADSEIEKEDRETSGIFLSHEDKLIESPIGFAHQRYFLHKQYYNLSQAGEISPEREDMFKVYLPLRVVRGLKINKWEQDYLPVFGVNGIKGVHPLFLISEDENGLIYSAVCKEEDKPVLHSRLILSNDVEEHIRHFFKNYFGILDLTSRNTKASKNGDKKPPAESSDPKEDQKDKNNNTPEQPTGSYELPRIESKSDIWDDPQKIVKYLDNFVIGQEEAKKAVAVAFSNYMLEVKEKADLSFKENCLLIGPSGTGKTYLISLLAKIASIPFVQAKLTGKSAEGYVGQNLTSSLFRNLRQKVEGEMPYGIVFLDEIDKIARDNWGGAAGFGSRLQNDMIGWLEEATIKLDKDFPILNTKNLFFIAAGAFGGVGNDSLADIISKRLGGGDKKVGFLARNEQHAGEKDLLHKVLPEDLINYGLAYELIGRLPNVAVFDALTKEEMIKIVTESADSPINKYHHLFKKKGYDLDIEIDVPEAIINNCPEGTGARAINSTLIRLFKNINYDPKPYADGKIIRVTSAIVEELLKKK